MPSDDSEMRIPIRNTDAHTMEDPTVERKQNDQSNGYVLKLNVSTGV